MPLGEDDSSPGPQIRETPAYHSVGTEGRSDTESFFAAAGLPMSVPYTEKPLEERICRIEDRHGNLYSGTSLAHQPMAAPNLQKVTRHEGVTAPSAIADPPPRQGNNDGFCAVHIKPGVPHRSSVWFHNCGRVIPDEEVWNSVLKYEDPTKHSRYDRYRDPRVSYGKRCFGFLQIKNWVHSDKSPYPLAICPSCKSLNFILPDHQIGSDAGNHLYLASVEPLDIKPGAALIEDALYKIYIAPIVFAGQCNRIPPDAKDNRGQPMLGGERPWLFRNENYPPPFNYDLTIDPSKRKLKTKDAEGKGDPKGN